MDTTQNNRQPGPDVMYQAHAQVSLRVEEERLEPLEKEKSRRQGLRAQRLERQQADVDRHNSKIEKEIEDETNQRRGELDRIDGQIAELEETLRDVGSRADDAEAGEDDIHVTPPIEIIRKLGLPGPVLKEKATRIIKPVLTVTSVVVSGFSIGIVIHILTPKHLFDHMDAVITSLIFGAAVSLGLFGLATKGWGLYGRRVVSRVDSRLTLAFLSVLTFVLLAIFAFLDGHALYLINASRIDFKPELQTDRLTSLLIGLGLSGLYIGGLSVTGYVDGYNDALTETVKAMQDVERQKVHNDPLNLARAYESRKWRRKHEACQARLDGCLRERARVEKALADRLQQLKSSLKDRPDQLPLDEEDRELEAQIVAQRQRVHAATIRCAGSEI